MTALLEMANGPFGPKYVSTAKPIIPQTSPTDRLHRIMESYQQFLIKVPDLINRTHSLSTISPHIPKIGMILNNDDFQQFLMASQAWEAHPDYDQATTYFLSYHLQQSHDEGINSFHFDLRGLKPIRLAREIEVKHLGLEVVVKGQLADNAFFSCNGGTYYLESAGNSCARSAHGTTFYIAKAGKGAGLYSRSSTYYIKSLDFECQKSRGSPLGCTVTFHTPSRNAETYFRQYYQANVIHHTHDWDKVWRVAAQKLGDA